MTEKLTDEMVGDVRSRLAEVVTITREEITTRRMTFHVTPKLAVPSKRRLDVEHEIIKQYCNAPHCLYVDDSTYRFTLVCN